MADESRWDEDERRRRWEEERYRRGGQYGRESQYGREGWREMTGYGGEGYGRDYRGGGGYGGGYGEGRGQGYGYGGGYSGGSYANEGWRGSEGYRGGQSQNYGASGREYGAGGREYSQPSYGEMYRGWPGEAPRGQGYVGMGPEQGFWRSGGYSAGQGTHTPYSGTDYGYGDRRRAGQGYSAYSGYGTEGGRDWRNRGEERGFFERAGDEVASWFGDDDAQRRREMDARRQGEHRGRGPRGYTRSDERIREDVCDRLSDDPMVDASDIEIAVSGAEVTLNGHVSSRWQKRRAEDLADDISGVKHVQNNLRVQEWGSQQSGTAARTSGMTGTTTGSTATTAATTRGREKV
jgi:osmotically-inducible protein OsmY